MQNILNTDKLHNGGKRKPMPLHEFDSPFFPHFGDGTESDNVNNAIKKLKDNGCGGSKIHQHKHMPLAGEANLDITIQEKKKHIGTLPPHSDFKQ